MVDGEGRKNEEYVISKSPSDSWERENVGF